MVVLLAKLSHRQHLITHCGAVSATCTWLLSSMSRRHMRPSLSCHSHASVGWYATLLCGIRGEHGVLVLLARSSHRQHLITHCGVVSATCTWLPSSMSRQHARPSLSCHSHASVGWYATLLCCIGGGTWCDGHASDVQPSPALDHPLWCRICHLHMATQQHVTTACVNPCHVIATPPLAGTRPYCAALGGNMVCWSCSQSPAIASH